MTVFNGFDDLSYFTKFKIIITIILFIVFYYLTSSVYQSIVLAISVMYIHYRYEENKIKDIKEKVNSHTNHVNELDNINLDEYQEEIIKDVFPKSKYINDYNNKTFLKFLFLNQEFYYYNQQAWIDMVSDIDKFLEIYDDITIDISQAGILYNSMKDKRNDAIENLKSIKINCPDKRTVIEKINRSIDELENIMNKYLYDVYIKNKINIENNGYNNHTTIINPNLFEN